MAGPLMPLLLVLCIGPIPDRGETLFLRVEEFGFENVLDDGSEPTRELLSSLQIEIRPGKPFSGKARIGKRTLSARGVCHPEDERGLMLVEIKTGLAAGNKEGLFSRSTCNTSISVPIEKRILVAGFRSRGTTEGVPGTRLTESYLYLTIRGQDPDGDDVPDVPTPPDKPVPLIDEAPIESERPVI